MHHVKPLNHMYLTGLALLEDVLVPVKNNLTYYILIHSCIISNPLHTGFPRSKIV